jgi:GNAT superfamily N-acetyltransferase
MTSAFTIEAAQPADVPAILSLIRELAVFERLAHLVVATEDYVLEALFGPQPAAEVLLARLAGEAVGFALYYHNFSTFLGRRGLWLEDLYVRPAARGLGIGRALLLSVGEIARARGCGRFEWAVLDWNENAIRFYQSLGAKPLNDWTIMRVTGDALEHLPAPDKKTKRSS